MPRRLGVTPLRLCLLLLALSLFLWAGPSTPSTSRVQANSLYLGSNTSNQNSHRPPAIHIEQSSGQRVQIVNAQYRWQAEPPTATPTATGTATPTPLADATDVPATAIVDHLEGATVTAPLRIPTVYVSGVTGLFFSGNNSIFAVATQTPWIFSQSFPMLNFNPGSMDPCTITPPVTRDTRPLTDLIISDPCAEIPAQVTGTPTASAGEGNLSGFQAVFTGDLYVSDAGDLTFNIYSDDGFILGLGPNRDGSGAQPGWVIGPFDPPRPPTPPYPGPTPWPTTTFRNYYVVGQFNTGGYGNSTEVINFPAPGFYPFELDYAENGLGGLSIAIEYTQGTPVPGGPSATPTATPTATCVPGPIPCIGNSQNLAGASNTLNGVFSIDQSDVWVVGGRHVTQQQGDSSLTEHWDGANWQIVPVSQDIGELNAVAAANIDGVWHVYAASDAGIIHQTGGGTPGTWGTPYPNVPGANALYASGATIYAAGGNVLQAGTGSPTVWSTLTPIAGGVGLNGVAATKGNNGNQIWAVGSNGSAPFSLHRHDNAWTVEAVPTPAGATSAVLNSVDIVTEGDLGTAVWAVGYYVDSQGGQHTLTEFYAHWPGMAPDAFAWRIVPSPDGAFGSGTLTSVWVTASLNVWAVGTAIDYPGSMAPLILTWTGTSWQRSNTPYLGGDGELHGVVSHTPALSLWTAGAYRVGFATQNQTLVEYIKAPGRPGATQSYYEQQVSVSDHATQGCAAAQTPVGGGGKLVILDYGQPQLIAPSRYGTKLIHNGTIVPNTKIEAAAKSFIDSYQACSTPGAANPIVVVMGVNNSYSSALNTNSGAAWAQVVNNLKATYTAVPNVVISGGIDAESGPDFDPGYTATANWVQGFLSHTGQDLYNFGSIDSFPYRPTPGPTTPTPVVPDPWTAHDGWNMEQHYQISAGLGIGRIYALPETYTNFKTGYWYTVARYGFDVHQETISFAGQTNSGCCVQLDVTQGWPALWLALNGDSQLSQPLRFSTTIGDSNP